MEMKVRKESVSVDYSRFVIDVGNYTMFLYVGIIDGSSPQDKDLSFEEYIAFQGSITRRNSLACYHDLIEEIKKYHSSPYCEFGIWTQEQVKEMYEILLNTDVSRFNCKCGQNLPVKYLTSSQRTCCGAIKCPRCDCNVFLKS